jgi:ABC-2 type transport system permease protein
LNSSWEKLGIVIKYEFIKHIRRKRLYIIMGIVLLAEALALILVPALNHGHYPASGSIMAGLLTAFGAQIASLGAVFFAGDAIAGEYEAKTGFLLFTNPIRREVLWIGKYLAGFLATAVVIAFAYIIVAVSVLSIYHSVPLKIFESFGLCLFYGGAMLSTTFLFSAVSKGSMGATITTLLFVWVFCGILESVLAYTSNPYWFVLSAGGDSIALPYGSLKDIMAAFGSLGDQKQSLGNFKQLSLGMAAWGMTIYFIGGFIGSILFSRKRQLS